jgi:hypothetical protein
VEAFENAIEKEIIDGLKLFEDNDGSFRPYFYAGLCSN